MKTVPSATVVAALLAAAAFGSMPAHAAGKCDRPQGVGEQRACEMAAQGNETLRRFVERTRSIYALYYFDFARESPMTAGNAAPGHLAAASDSN